MKALKRLKCVVVLYDRTSKNVGLAVEAIEQKRCHGYYSTIMFGIRGGIVTKSFANGGFGALTTNIPVGKHYVLCGVHDRSLNLKCGKIQTREGPTAVGTNLACRN